MDRWKKVCMVILCIVSVCGSGGCAGKRNQDIRNQQEDGAVEDKGSEEIEFTSEAVQMIETEEQEVMITTETEVSEEAAETPEEKTVRLRESAPKEPLIEKEALTDLHIEIHKRQHALQLWNGTDLIAEYAVGLAKNPVGAKEKEGDNKNPEGTYYICSKNSKSQYHLALGLSYPNIDDASRGYEQGLISEVERDSLIYANENGKKPDWYTALGGEIMIHGQKGELGGESDWTRGCFAVDNAVMDMIWDYVEVGTFVEITAD